MGKSSAKWSVIAPNQSFIVHLYYTLASAWPSNCRKVLKLHPSISCAEPSLHHSTWISIPKMWVVERNVLCKVIAMEFLETWMCNLQPNSEESPCVLDQLSYINSFAYPCPSCLFCLHLSKWTMCPKYPTVVCWHFDLKVILKSVIGWNASNHTSLFG
jgi:hypothetical protein